MNEATLKIREIVATDIMGLAQLAMEGDIGINEKVDRNTLKDSNLYKSIKTEIQNSNDIVINALFQHYINYIEWDRPPEYGDKPPIDELKDWAESRGISTDNATLWAISTAIWRDGHDGRPIIEMFNNLIEFSFNEYWAEDLFNSTIDELIKYFN